MKQYRKKPVIIEAVQFNGLNPTEIKDFVGEYCEVEIYDNEVTPPVAHIIIHTLEGDMKVSNGDYVIKGVKGEFYPCKPDIFEQTYESAEIQKELEEAAWDCVLDSVDVNNPVLLPKYKELLTFLFKAGAKWQKEQDMKMLEANWGEGFRRGKIIQKEQMMKEAVETVMQKDDCDDLVPTLSDMSKYGFKSRDKVKVIIIKDNGNN